MKSLNREFSGLPVHKRVNFIRLSRKITIDKMALAMGLKPYVMRSILYGKSVIKVDHLMKMAKILDVEVSTLLK